ncbi:MAG: hypothetical protein K1X89_22755 [Myxococcaceae bacterium]|nr:hypothetical protein [Myxococcaceae bacterium]
MMSLGTHEGVRLGPQPERVSPLTLQVTDGVHRPEAIARAHDAVSRLAGIPSGVFWIRAADVRAWHQGDLRPETALAAYFGESLARFLFQHFARLIEALPLGWGTSYGCLELWTKVVDSRRQTVWPHVDTVPLHDGWKSACPSPMWGSVLYLSPEGQGHGDTVFCPQDPPSPAVLDLCMAERTEEELRSTATDWQRVRARPGRLVVFRGSLAHYVAPNLPQTQAPRVTVLVNVWDQVPRFEAPFEGPCRITPEEFAAFARLPRAVVDLIADGALALPDELLAQVDPADLELVFAALLRLG